MASGPYHFKRAEALIAGRKGHLQSLGVGTTEEAIALAQVHATLAQAAATMDLTGATVNGQVSAGWKEVLDA